MMLQSESEPGLLFRPTTMVGYLTMRSLGKYHQHGEFGGLIHRSFGRSLNYFGANENHRGNLSFQYNGNDPSRECNSIYESTSLDLSCS